MKNYQHIALVNSLSDEECKKVLRKTMVYWIGKPTYKKANTALDRLVEFCFLEQDHDVKCAVKVVVVDFSALKADVKLQDYYVDEFLNLRTHLVDSEGLEKDQFLEMYDRRIQIKVDDLRRRDISYINSDPFAGLIAS
jgi:hypothetical protein